jgi:hypothetical protein
MFTPDRKAASTQRVCSSACRTKRNCKLQRARRCREIQDCRDDERERQRASRVRRRSEGTCHAPPSEPKSSKVKNKSEQIVDRTPTLSRATFERQVTENLRLLTESMANLVTVTQQLVQPSTGYRTGIPDESGTCHATGST